MKAHMKVVNPDRIEFTMEITLDLASWKKLDERLSGFGPSAEEYPSFKLREAIHELVRKAEANFFFSE